MIYKQELNLLCDPRSVAWKKLSSTSVDPVVGESGTGLLIGLQPEHVDNLVAPVADGECEMSLGVFRGGRVTGRDTIAELVPDRRFAYTHTSNLPVRDYRGEVELEPTSSGTAIKWVSSFEPKIPPRAKTMAPIPMAASHRGCVIVSRKRRQRGCGSRAARSIVTRSAAIDSAPERSISTVVAWTERSSVSSASVAGTWPPPPSPRPSPR